MDIFVNDIDYRASVSMHILQIGELIKRLSDEYISQTVNKMNWYAIRGMHNYPFLYTIFHKCFDVNFKKFINTLRIENACLLLAE